MGLNVEGAHELLGDRAIAILAAIEVLRDTPDETWVKVLERAERASTLGPMLDPTTWIQPGAVDGHQAWVDVFTTCRKLGRIARGEGR